ncbi:MAG: LamG-like jellyroll fold domain-containing protein, partial [Candidatus Nealsonbacteria bacterium]
ENIGWISFSCKNENNPINYGVDIDEAGNFSGHAWSENIGWVSFERSETGPPPEAPDFGTHLAEVDIITGKVSGWARALSACQDNLWNGTNCTGSGAGDKSGGWNGWIKLRGPSISTSGLLASWSMDENSGTQILDSSGNDNTGNFGLGSKAPTWDDGKYNSGLRFDGNNDYIGFTGINTAKTQEAWIYLTQSAPDKGNVNHLFNNFYQHYANDYFYFNGTNDYIPWVPTINTWYHLVLIYTDKADTGTAKLYVNGVPYNAAQQVGPHAIQSIGTISYPAVNSAFAGIIDEVRIYDRVLTDEEILAHYNGYGVDIDKDTGDFSNYSWSNMIIGWTSFNSIDTGSPINYKVQTFFNFDRAPEIQNLNYSSPTTCSYEMSIPIFSWDYSDEDDVPLGTDPQTIYQIRIDNDSTFGVDANDDPILDGDEYRCSGSLCEVTTPVHSFSPQPAEWISWTDYGQTYYWKARVKDSNGKWSSWSSSVSFITQAHPYSEPNFSSAPEIIVVNEDVNFTDLSTCYYSSGVDYDCKDEPVNLYAWDFDGNLTVDSTTRGDVTYQYTSSGSYIAILEIKDDVGTCDIQVPLGALVPLPEYKEVAPTSYFGGLFADVLHFFKNLLFS